MATGTANVSHVYLNECHIRSEFSSRKTFSHRLSQRSQRYVEPKSTLVSIGFADCPSSNGACRGFQLRRGLDPHTQPQAPCRRITFILYRYVEYIYLGWKRKTW